jgi:hypothetical protein
MAVDPMQDEQARLLRQYPQKPASLPAKGGFFSNIFGGLTGAAQKRLQERPSQVQKQEEEALK